MPKGKRKPSSTVDDKEVASLILDSGLYLGPCSAASSSGFLKTAGITHILSIGSTPAAHFPGITYERLPLTDSPSSDVARTAGAAGQFINSALGCGGRVLVHCSAAISRSPTLVTAYLMKSRGMTLKEALGRIVRARPATSPNSGFLEQLKQMEMEIRGGCTLEVDELPRRRQDREALFVLADEAHRNPASGNDPVSYESMEVPPRA